MKRFFPVFLALLVSLLWFGQAAAQEPQPTPSDDEVNAIARQLFCPVCENTPLDVCPTDACKQWRALIREKLVAGWTEQQIKDFFVEQYGARVLAEPPRQGFSWLVYLVPPVLLAIGAYIVFQALRSMRKPARAGAAPIHPQVLEGDDYLKRVEEELKKRNQE